MTLINDTDQHPSVTDVEQLVAAVDDLRWEKTQAGSTSTKLNTSVTVVSTLSRGYPIPRSKGQANVSKSAGAYGTLRAPDISFRAAGDVTALSEIPFLAEVVTNAYRQEHF